MLGCFSFCIHDLTELYEIMGRSGFLCVHVKFPSPPHPAGQRTVNDKLLYNKNLCFLHEKSSNFH